ncbi:hypothetical protein UY3_07195 [Chelonia mydas]|uniref:Uncharacterized protein n=1 Tax=Chelonia mydas TaxID=8469 RepID=M7C501_CHEMY|nr:hypothetical protein UY3_07195 [Chelonia mydas]
MAVSRLLLLPRRLRFRLSQAGVPELTGSTFGDQFIASRRDMINRSPIDRSLPAYLVGSEDLPLENVRLEKGFEGGQNKWPCRSIRSSLRRRSKKHKEIFNGNGQSDCQNWHC